MIREGDGIFFFEKFHDRNLPLLRQLFLCFIALIRCQIISKFSWGYIPPPTLPTSTCQHLNILQIHYLFLSNSEMEIFIHWHQLSESIRSLNKIISSLNLNPIVDRFFLHQNLIIHKNSLGMAPIFTCDHWFQVPIFILTLLQSIFLLNSSHNWISQRIFKNMGNSINEIFAPPSWPPCEKSLTPRNEKNTQTYLNLT